MKNYSGQFYFDGSLLLINENVYVAECQIFMGVDVVIIKYDKNGNSGQKPLTIDADQSLSIQY